MNESDVANRWARMNPEIRSTPKPISKADASACRHGIREGRTDLFPLFHIDKTVFAAPAGKGQSTPFTTPSVTRTGR